MLLLDVNCFCFEQFSQGHLFCGTNSLPLSLEMPLCSFDRVGEMAVNHVGGEAGPGGIVALLDCVCESFFWGKACGGVVPQQSLFCAWQVKDDIDFVGRLGVLER